MAEWIEACGADEIDEEDVVRFDHEGRTFAIYRSPDDEYFATDGLCTRQQASRRRLVMNDHRGAKRKRFNYKTGEAKGCVNLKTYPTRVEAGRVLIQIG